MTGPLEPLQTYKCPEHGEFEERIPFSQDVPATMRCPVKLCPANKTGCDGKGRTCSRCSRQSPHVLYPPAIRIVDGTTPSR